MKNEPAKERYDTMLMLRGIAMALIAGAMMPMMMSIIIGLVIALLALLTEWAAKQHNDPQPFQGDDHENAR